MKHDGNAAVVSKQGLAICFLLKGKGGGGGGEREQEGEGAQEGGFVNKYITNKLWCCTHGSWTCRCLTQALQ